MKEPIFVPDAFNIYDREVSTGQIFCESEKQALMQKYQQHLAGKAKLEGVPVKGAAAKFFAKGKHL